MRNAFAGSRWGHKLLASLVLVSTVLLTAFALSATVRNIGSTPFVISKTSESLTPGDRVVTSCRPADNETVLVFIDLEQLAVSERIVHGHVTLDLPVDAAQHLLDRQSRLPIFGGDPEPVLNPKFKDGSLDLIFTQLSSGLKQHVSLALAGIRFDPISPGPTVPVALPLEGDPAQYPGDKYLTAIEAELQLPPEIVYFPDLGIVSALTPGAFSVQAQRTLPTNDLYVCVRVGPTMSASVVNWSWHLSDYKGHDPQLNSAVVEVSRTSDVQNFTWLLLFVPVLGLAVLLHGLAALRPSDTGDRRKGDRSNGGDIVGLALGLLPLMFAIVALHTALVPSDVPGVTRVDLLLADEVVVLLLTIVVLYAWKIWFPPRSARQPPVA